MILTRRMLDVSQREQLSSLQSSSTGQVHLCCRGEFQGALYSAADRCQTGDLNFATMRFMRTRLDVNAQKWWTLGAMLIMTFAAASSQQPVPSPQSKVLPLTPDRVADSYAIYSELLPGHEIEWGDVPRAFWLVEEETKAEPLDKSCATGGQMNPHRAIQAPQPEQTNFAELLGDFDERCHNRYKLDASQFHVKLPIHLLDEDGQKRYSSRVSGFLPPRDNIMQAPPTPEEFAGAAGMHSFTAVYFNKAHTLAMTKIGMYCGSLCGNWRWVVLEKKNGKWQSLPWQVMMMVSKLCLLPH